MVCAHHHELQDKASASLRHCYLPMPSLTKKRVSEKTVHSLELINKIGIKCNFKKYERIYANTTILTKNYKRHLNTGLPVAVKD